MLDHKPQLGPLAAAMDLPLLQRTGRRIHEDLADVIRVAIRDGTLRQGRPLPGSAGMTRRYKVSLQTVAATLRLLSAEGLVRKADGRSGRYYVRGVLPAGRHNLTRYMRHGCRCPDCKRAVREYRRRRREQTPPEKIPHGTTQGYNHFRCRCEPCRAAKRRYRDEWKGRR